MWKQLPLDHNLLIKFVASPVHRIYNNINKVITKKKKKYNILKWLFTEELISTNLPILDLQNLSPQKLGIGDHLTQKRKW